MAADFGTHIRDSQIKRRRRKQYILVILVVFLLFLISGGAYWLFWRSSVFEVKGIEVSGLKTLTKEEVIDFVRGRFLGRGFVDRWFGEQNLFAWPETLKPEDLALLPILKSVSIGRQYFDRTILIKVAEREPYAIWCNTESEVKLKSPGDRPQSDQSIDPPSQASCFWFDVEGVLFKQAFGAQGNLISVIRSRLEPPPKFGEKILPDRFISNLISVFETLKASALSLREVLLENIANEEIEVRTTNGPVIYFSLRFPAESTLAALQSLSVKPEFKKLEYVDFRVENRAYYK